MKGSYYKRGCTCKKKRCACNTTWAFTIDIGKDPQTGKRRQKTKSGFSSKEEAVQAANQLMYELYNDTYIEESEQTFAMFSQEWLTIYKEVFEVKPGTIRIRLYELNKLMPYFAELKLKDITRKTYQDALNDLKALGYSHSTMKGINRTGKMIFRKALELELIKKDPTVFAYLKKDKKLIEAIEENEIPKYMEKEELALFLETARKQGLTFDYIMFLVLAYTGIRIGELVSLTWQDIDFKAHTIKISKTYYNPNNNTRNYQLVAPKTKSSRRTIVIDQLVIDALLKHRAEQNRIKKQFGDSYKDDQFVFTNVNKYPGYPIVIKVVQLRMARLLRLCQLSTDFTPHTLRHTHTSLLAEAGVSLEQIMERLGHIDDQTTKNIYLHITKEMKKEASHKFAQLMESFDL